MATRAPPKHDPALTTALPLRDARASAGPFPTTIFRHSSARVRFNAYAILFLVDSFCIAGAFLLASAFRLGSPVEQGIPTLVAVLPIYFLLGIHNGAYSVAALRNPSVGRARALQAFACATAVAIGLLFYFKISSDFSRLVFAVGTVLAVVIVAAARSAFGPLLGSKHQWIFANRLVLVDGVSVLPRPGDTMFFADRLGIEPRDDPLLLDRLGTLLRQCDSVVVACSPERRKRWSHLLKASGADVELLVPELSELGAIEVRDFHGQQTVLVSCRPLSVTDRALKRAFDIVAALLALLLFAPLMVAVAIAIMIESSGPILFRQERVGQNNRLFYLLKFRSMAFELSDPTGSRSASHEDHRVTRVGRFIRRTSLDELPQIFNVLAGQMSIVGPRPHALGSTAERALFWEIDGRYFHRHAIKPGITGLAQVRGYRGATAKKEDVENRLQSDLEYLSGWTIWRDLKITFATAGVLVHENAF